MEFRKLINLVEKEEPKDERSGFDSETMQALAAIRARYPSASDDLSALLRHVTNIDNDSDSADEDHSARIKDLEARVDTLEKMLRDKD